MYKDPITKFWFKVNKEGDNCWLWDSSRDNKGYGRYKIVLYGKTETLAHRVSWSLMNETSIPKGRVVLHTCDNPPCVNPKHLIIGTQLDNIRDMVNKDRQSKGEYSGTNKLNSDDVLKIRKLHFSEGITQTELAKLYNISLSAISGILLGSRWKSVNGKTGRHLIHSKKRRELEERDVISIRNEYASGNILQRELAIKYGVSQAAIQYIVTGKNRKDVSGIITNKGAFNRKLRGRDIKEIRELFSKGDYTYVNISNIYNITPSYARKIILKLVR